MDKPACMSAPTSSTTHVPLQAPSLRRRMACWLYESLLLFGVVFVGGIVLGTAGVLFGALLSPRTLQAVLFVVLGMYFAFFWSKGQTLAMKTWRIQVVDNNGRPSRVCVHWPVMRYAGSGCCHRWLLWHRFICPWLKWRCSHWAGSLSGPCSAAFTHSASFCTMC